LLLHRHRFLRNIQGNGSQRQPPDTCLQSGGTRTVPATCSVLYTEAGKFNLLRVNVRRAQVASSREYPDRPVIGVGGVIIDQGRPVEIRRGTERVLGEGCSSDDSMIA